VNDEEKKQAQAMLNAAIAQRNQALDQVIQLSAMLALAQEKATSEKAPDPVSG
jgi:hypothetical protein